MAAQQKIEMEETDLKVSSTLPPPPPSPPVVVSDRSTENTDLKSQQISVVSNVKPTSTIEITDLKKRSCKQDDESTTSSSSSSIRESLPASPPQPSVVNRKRQRGEVSTCSGKDCRRKIGLMPFRCRCGEVFCPEHRYSDRHDCTYDYKSAGREAIAKENPVVKAAKIIKV